MELRVGDIAELNIGAASRFVQVGTVRIAGTRSRHGYYAVDQFQPYDGIHPSDLANARWYLSLNGKCADWRLRLSTVGMLLSEDQLNDASAG